MTSTTSNKREERAQDRAIERTIDETKDSTRRALQEVKKEIPEFTAAFHDYQEQNINTIRQMTTEFLESQKEVAKSLRSAGANGQSGFWNWAFPGMGMNFWPYNPWAYPQDAAEFYSRLASNSAEGAIAATRLSNEMIISSMEATKNSLKHAQNNSRAVSSYMVDSANELNRTSQEKR
jgi:glutamate synthase domain-containing protein 1